MKQSRYSKLFMIPVIAGAALLAFTLLTPQAFAQENTTGDACLNKSLVAIAAAIAIAGGLIGTGNAQQGIGAAGMGIIAEKPEKFGQVLFFFVIPETLWIIGFVLGIILLLGIL